MVGEHKLKPLPYAYDSLKGISEQVAKWHHDTHQAGYVNKRNEIEKKLENFDVSAANANYSEYGELKRRETFNASGMILHEIYWDVMGGDGNMDESLEVVKKIKEDFGSIDKWKADFTACSKASMGWSILCFDFSDGKVHNFLVDSHNNGAVWNSMVLVPCDVWEHAYYHDQGPNRAAYIEAFFKNINWAAVNERFLTFYKK